jgi:hypothetical protein
MIRSGVLRRVLFGAIILGLLSFFVAVGRSEAQPIAMVTDLVGRAEAINNAARVPLGILADLPDGARVELNPGARMVALYLATGDEHTLSGPVSVVFKSSGVQTLSGEAPIRRVSSMNRDGSKVRINPVGFAQGAMVLRSARPAGTIAPLNLYGTVTLEARPEFRWRGVSGAKRYHLQLQDDAGQTLFETEVDGESLRLPESIKLREGTGYIWEIATRLPDGRRYVSSGDFRVATADLRALVERVRPARDAEVAERIAFAAWLENVELRDEARAYWEALAVERPDSARLRDLARP